MIVNAVPGFQELMDMQRGLSDLAAVEGASVSSYRNGEASLELTLNAPVTAREIIDGDPDKLRETIAGHDCETFFLNRWLDRRNRLAAPKPAKGRTRRRQDARPGFG